MLFCWQTWPLREAFGDTFEQLVGNSRPSDVSRAGGYAAVAT